MKDLAAQQAERSRVGSASSSARRRKFESGQSMIEFALMLPFMMLLSIGIVEIGRAAYISIVVTNGATAGVEYGAQSGTTAVDVTGMQTAAANDVANNAIGGTMSATPTWGCYCDTGTGTSCQYVSGGLDCNATTKSSCSCSPSGISSTCTAGVGQIVQCVQVDTHVNFTPLFNWPGLPTAYQSNGHSVMRVRQ